MIFRALVLALGFFFLGVFGASAVDKYWVGGTASWDGTAGTKWALTDGGAGGAPIPSSIDNVFFTAASGVVTVTVATGNTGALAVNCTGFTGTIAGSAAISVSGSITLVSGMTFTNTSAWTMLGTGSVTMAGKTMTSVTVNGSGITVTPVGTVNLSVLGLTQGTWAADTNDPAHNLGIGISASGTSTRVLSMGDGIWTVSGTTSNIWNITDPTSMTLNRNGSSIVLDGNNTSTTTSRTFTAGAFTYGATSFTGTGTLAIAGSPTFVSFTMNTNVRQQMLVTSGTTLTATTFTVDGTATYGFTLGSVTVGTTGTISVASGTPTMDYTAVRDLVFQGGATWTATNSVNLGNNTGLTFQAGGAHGYGLGGPYFTSN